MSKLTDLEICKKIAEIEGVKAHEFQGVLILMEGYNEVVNEAHNNSYSFIASESKWVYNPITDKALCFDLMVKNEIILSYTDIGFKAAVTFTRWVINKNPQRAVLLAIIKKSEIK